MSTESEQERGGGCAKGRNARWVTPVTGVLIGVVYLVVFLARHEVKMAVFGLVAVVGYVTFLALFSGRWGAAALLRGDVTDERRRTIDQQAAALTLRVLSVVLVGGFIVSAARGTGETTWAAMCAVLGAVYIGSTIVLTRRG